MKEGRKERRQPPSDEAYGPDKYSAIIRSIFGAAFVLLYNFSQSFSVYLSVKWKSVENKEGERERRLVFKRMGSGVNRPLTESWHCCILTL